MLLRRLASPALRQRALPLAARACSSQSAAARPVQVKVEPPTEAAAEPDKKGEEADAGLRPREIVEYLNRYIVGQADAKRAVAVALRNRWRRQRVSPPLRDEIMPKCARPPSATADRAPPLSTAYTARTQGARTRDTSWRRRRNKRRCKCRRLRSNRRSHRVAAVSESRSPSALLAGTS